MTVLKRKHVLVLSDVYTFGGLETHILSAFKVLKKLGYEIYYVTGKEYVDENLPKDYCAHIYTGLSLSFNSTASDILQDVDFITGLINKHNIDIVHCHPFAGLIPAFIASQETQRPFVYTLHGPGSLDVPFGQLYEFLLKSVVLPATAVLHCVSPETEMLAAHFNPGHTYVAPNGIDVQLFTPDRGQRVANEIKKCCVVSRIDVFKLPSIQFFIEQAVAAGCKEIDIIGDGAEKQALVNWIAGLSNNEVAINVLGFKQNIAELIKQYDLVAGMGRVVLEAAACNIPVVLAGYDGVKGLADAALLRTASIWNYSGRGLANITAYEFQAQLEQLKAEPAKYQLREWVLENANEDTIWSGFSARLQQAEYRQADFVPELMSSLRWAGQRTTPLLSDVDFLNNVKEALLNEKYIASRHSRFMNVLDRKAAISTLINHANGHFGNVFMILERLGARLEAIETSQEALQSNQETFKSNQEAFESNQNIAQQSALQQVIAGLNSIQGMLSTRFNELQAIIAQKEQQVKTLEGEKQGFVQERDRLLTEQQQQAEAFKIQQRQLNLEIEKLNNDISTVKGQLDEVKTNQQRLQTALQESDTALKVAQERNSHSSEQNQSLKQLLMEKSEEVEVLKRQLEWFQQKYSKSFINRIFNKK